MDNQKEKLRKQSHLQSHKKYIGINLTKKIKDLKIVSLRKEIENTNKCKYTTCSWIGRINIDQMSIYSKKTIDSKQSLSKHQWHFSQS